MEIGKQITDKKLSVIASYIYSYSNKKIITALKYMPKSFYIYIAIAKQGEEQEL